MTKQIKSKSDTNKQLIYSLSYGLVFSVFYLILGNTAGRLTVGIASGLINGTLVFILNNTIFPSKFWDPLETRREKLDNYLWWIGVCIFTYITYGIITYIAI